MAYATYTTDALVCGSFDRGRADRSVLIFAREAGMLFAVARSAREERSRQRYALQDLSYLRVSLVRGKSGWRIGSTEPYLNFYSRAPDRTTRGSTVSLVRLLRRFIRGEEAAPVLFDELITGLTALTEPAEPAPKLIEQVVTLRLLAALGHVAHEQVPSTVRSGTYAQLPRENEDVLLSKLEALIADAVAESQL